MALSLAILYIAVNFSRLRYPGQCLPTSVQAQADLKSAQATAQIIDEETHESGWWLLNSIVRGTAKHADKLNFFGEFGHENARPRSATISTDWRLAQAQGPRLRRRLFVVILPEQSEAPRLLPVAL
jgi:hypothetical protein